jgi:hypothetical protein
MEKLRILFINKLKTKKGVARRRFGQRNAKKALSWGRIHPPGERLIKREKPFAEDRSFSGPGILPDFGSESPVYAFWRGAAGVCLARRQSCGITDAA